MKKKVMIGNKSVGEGQPCFIVGEIGSNHCRDKNVVRELIDAAEEAKFDAVKFQTYDPELAFTKNMTTTDLNFQNIYGHKPWWEVARDEILMPREWFPEMYEYAQKKGLIAFCTGHHKDDLEFLTKTVPTTVLKIASIDMHYMPFLKDVVKYDIPVILATGMAYLNEIDETVRFFRENGKEDIILLHCISCYPPETKDTNLRNLITLKNAFGLPVGFSDHDTSNYPAIASVALGCCLIEKHITLNKKNRGPDHPFALEPKDMVELVKGVREVELALGATERVISEKEKWSRKWVRRSAIAIVDIPEKTILTEEMLKFGRPAGGIDPNDSEKIIGKPAARNIKAEELIQFKDFNL